MSTGVNADTRESAPPFPAHGEYPRASAEPDAAQLAHHTARCTARLQRAALLVGRRVDDDQRLDRILISDCFT
jgi:hypothetical protein